MLCKYGCGQEARFQLKNGAWCCSEHYNKCSEKRKKNSDGIKRAHKRGIHAPGFTDESREKSLKVRLDRCAREAFMKGSSRSNISLKRHMLKVHNIEDKCVLCGISSWQNQKLNLPLDHIDGNSANNDLTNLRILCPNCHSQTDTFCGKSINTGKKRISNEQLLTALQDEKNIRQALINVGLSPRGGNYARAYKLLNGGVDQRQSQGA